MLVAKKCSKCEAAMHIHSHGEEVVFSGCEPCLVKIKIEKVSDEEVVLKAHRSTKRIRCTLCKSTNLIASFDEVKDGNGSNTAKENTG